MELTAGGLLIGVVLAVALAVAELRARDATMLAAGRAARAKVLIVGAGDGGAISLVAAVAAIAVAVTLVRGRDAERVAAPELPDVARRETCATQRTAYMYILPHKSRLSSNT